jgi:hypothetical protein
MITNVDILGKPETIRALNTANRAAEMRIINIVERYTWLVHGEGIRQMPRDQGDLARHHHVQVKALGSRDVIGEVRNTARHAAAVENGSVPHWPPPGALAAWASKHGIEEGAIRYFISLRGTPAQPYMKPAFDRYKNEFRRAIRQIVP